MLNFMLKFLRNNWKPLLAIGSAAVCIFYPPGLVAGTIIGIASSPPFAAFGAYAATVATATVALVSAAVTFGILELGARVASAAWILGERIRSQQIGRGAADDDLELDLRGSSTAFAALGDPVARRSTDGLLDGRRPRASSSLKGGSRDTTPHDARKADAEEEAARTTPVGSPHRM